MNGFLSFADTALGVDCAVFGAAAVVVWIAGTRLSDYAVDLVRRTGIGQAVVGLLLLGGITSLPEVAVTVSASRGGAPALAVNNLLGGVTMQVAILAAADAVYGRSALTAVIADPRVLLQGTLCVLLLATTAVGVAAGGGAWLGIGVWSWLVAVLYVGSVWIISREAGQRTWVPKSSADTGEAPHPGQEDDGPAPPLSRTVPRIVAAAAAILGAGFVLSRTGEAIAEKTGLGASFVGAVLVAFATSLPEVSTVIGAVRRRSYEMAVSDIFGTNLADVALVFVADACVREGPVMARLGDFSVVAALLGIAVTTIYVAGLLERRDRTVLRMGVDSVAVLLTYIGGIFLLYRLR